MLNLIKGFLFVISVLAGNSESFEGRIELVQESLYTTTYFTYSIKDELVRVDQFDENHQIIQAMLVNLGKEEVFVLSPERKLYTELKSNAKPAEGDKNFEINKTENSRMVNGHKCYQWRVKNIERNTETTYWVLQNDFYFFYDFVKLINRTERAFEFFEKIPDSQGFFPMLTVERTLLRREKNRVSVIEIDPGPIDDKLFLIPYDYELFNP